MANDALLKTLSWLGVILLTFAYPTVFFLATLHTIYKTFFGKRVCKTIAGDIAVVTGGAHGLGKAISMELAQSGCHIAIVDINYEEAEKTAKLIAEKYSVKTKAYKVDVSNYEEVVQLNENISNDLGTATILINNAGVLLLSTIAEPDYSEVARMINVNLTAHFWTNRVFLRNMKQLKKGHIVAISSLSSFFPLIYNGVYTSTKFAVRGLMRVLRQELKSCSNNNIGATTVFPTFMHTNADVIKLVQKSGVDRLMPMLTGEEAARDIVRAMLRNEEEIALPTYSALVYRFYENLPAAWQDGIMVVPSIIGNYFKTNLYPQKKQKIH